MAWYDDINWTGAAVSGAGVYDQMQRYDQLGDDVEEGAARIAQEATNATTFQPFSVTSYGGSTNVGEGGNVDVALNSTAQARAHQLGQDANQFYASAAGDQSGREQDIYDKIRAMQQPGEERAYTDMESRLAAQGRMGISSAQYGGAPEQHAFGLAQAEARNNAAYQALEQARAQQAQDMSLGNMAHTNAWLDTAQLGNMANLGFQGAGMNQAGQFAGAQLGAQAGLTGLEGKINAEKVRADLMAGLFGSVGGAFDQPSSAGGSDPLWGAISDIFGLSGQ